MLTTKGNGWVENVGDRESNAGLMGITLAYESSLGRYMRVSGRTIKPTGMEY